MLAQGAVTAAAYLSSHRLRDGMINYPYLKDVDLVSLKAIQKQMYLSSSATATYNRNMPLKFQMICDYASRVPLSLHKMKENFEKALLPLSKVVGRDCPVSELQTIRMISAIEVHNEPNVWPAIQLLYVRAIFNQCQIHPNHDLIS